MFIAFRYPGCWLVVYERFWDFCQRNHFRVQVREHLNQKHLLAFNGLRSA